MLKVEPDKHLGYEKSESTEETKTNYSNGHTSKTLKSSVCPVEIDVDVPRDRNGEGEPKVVLMYKRNTARDRGIAKHVTK